MANNIKGITIEIGGDTTKLQNALKGVNGDLKSTKNELKEVEKGLKIDPKNTELLAQKQQLLTKAVGETKDKLDVLKTAEAQVEQQFKNGEASEEQYRAIKREVIATEAELKNLEEQAKASNSTLAKVGDAFGTVGDKATKAGEKMMPVTAGITALGAAGVAASMELDNGYDTIITKTGATGEALESLTTVADNVFSDMPTTMDDVGVAVGEVNTRFGATGTELENLSKEFIKFANINGTDLNTAIDSVDSIMTKFGVDASQTKNVLGLMTKAGQDTGISMETLETALTTNGASLKEMGLDLTSSVNLLAQMEASGVDVSTALAGMKKAVQNATADGKSADEALTETIDNIKNAKTETEALTIASDLFGKKGAAEMTQAIREGRLSVDDLSGALSDYGDVVSDTFETTLDPWDDAAVAMNNLKLAGADLGSSILTTLQPTIDKVVNKVKEFTTWFKNLDDNTKQMIVKIGMIVAAIGPAFMILVIKSITFWIAAIIGAAALITPFTILAMYVRTNSNTGFNAAMRLINACFRLSKSGCMVVHICEKASFTFPMVPSTFSLNSSFVLYKAMNPAASAAIIAITIPTGPVSADKTPLIPPILLVNPVTVFITPDIPVDIFPNMIKAGPGHGYFNGNIGNRTYNQRCKP